MKFLLSFLFSLSTLISLSHKALAQKELPAFGKIELRDLQLKDCAFDPGADAMKLIDWADMYFIRNTDDAYSFTTIFERRIRIKILKENGLSYANATIPFYSYNNDEKVLDIKACTFNISENGMIKKTVVLKNAIYKRRINKQYSEVIIVFPEVKAGSIVEYKYTLQRKTGAEVRDWYFQSNIPTRYSEYRVSIPSVFRFTLQPVTVDSLEMKETGYPDHSISKGGTVLQKNFIMRNLPAIRSEPFMGAAKDYLQRLSFRLSGIDYGNGNVVQLGGSWEEITKALMNDRDFGGRLKGSSKEAADLILKAAGLQKEESKVSFIFNYMKNNLQWNGRQTIYGETGMKNTFQEKSGSSGDINLALVAILNKAGVHASPILFSTRDNGLVNPSLPFLSQFNTVMALVENKEKYFILDATDKYASFDIIPEKIINTKGLIVEAGDARWQEATDTLHTFKVVTAVHGEIDTNAIMKADVLITANGYARTQYCEDWASGKYIFINDAADNEYSALKIDDNQAFNLDNDSLPAELKLRVSVPLNNAAGHSFFKINLFSGLEKNWFTTTERSTDIDFGYRQEYIIYGSYTIPGEYQFEELPQNISLIMPDTSIIFKRFISADNNFLNVRITINFRRPWYAAGEYPGLADFYKTLLSKLNEQVVIKKKETQ